MREFYFLARARIKCASAAVCPVLTLISATLLRSESIPMITNGILRQVICLLRQASLKGQGVLPHVQSVFPHNLLPLGRCPQADTDRVFPGRPRIRSMHDRFALREILAIWRVFITLLVLTGFAHATTYYVATNGKDSQTGTSSKPWLTISHADKVVQPGDTVIVEPGTYNVGNI